MFAQPRVWSKIIIGGLLFLVPVIGWLFVYGYGIRTMRSVIAGDEQLPEWTDFGGLLVTGLLGFVAGIIYSVPGLVLARFGATGAVLAILANILAGFVLPAALLRFAKKDDFGAFFDFGEIFAFIRDNFGNYVIVLLLAIVTQIIASFGVILLVIGVVFTVFWGLLVVFHLLGSLQRVADTAGVGHPPY
jgi:hypothetical protein